MVDIPQRTCSIPGCNKKHFGHGYCNQHHKNWWRYGDPLGKAPPKMRRAPAERFWAKVQKTETCWLWTGSINSDGYGTFWDGRLIVRAHRFAYGLLVDSSPEGSDIDHLCHNADTSCPGGAACLHRRCVKAIADEHGPAHLEPTTNRENVLRSPISPGGVNARKTHCPQGHPYDEANTYIKPGDGGRMCRVCYTARNQARNRTKRVSPN